LLVACKSERPTSAFSARGRVSRATEAVEHGYGVFCNFEGVPDWALGHTATRATTVLARFPHPDDVSGIAKLPLVHPDVT
jgi:hypothetical protein